MAEDTHGSVTGGSAGEPGAADGGGGGLLCPTCGHEFAPPRPPVAPLVEPIPDRPPLLWLKIAALATGAVLLLGGSALAAYRAGVTTGQTEAARGSGAKEETAPVSIDATLPASWDTSATRSWESSLTTAPAGSITGTATPQSMETSLNARLQSLRESLSSGGGMGSLGSDPYMGFGGGSIAPVTPPPESGAGGGAKAGSASGPAAGETDLSARATVRASSQLASARGFSYGPGNLIDGRGDTCWAEGAPGYGIGQSVTFDFGREVTITRLEVLPGYDKFFEVDRWSGNGRLRAATLRGDSGTHPISLADERRYQSVAVPSLRTRRLTVVISSAYPAVPGLHSATDTSIGELRVYGR